jgi:hypothetical protein
VDDNVRRLTCVSVISPSKQSSSVVDQVAIAASIASSCSCVAEG